MSSRIHSRSATSCSFTMSAASVSSKELLNVKVFIISLTLQIMVLTSGPFEIHSTAIRYVSHVLRNQSVRSQHFCMPWPHWISGRWPPYCPSQTGFSRLKFFSSFVLLSPVWARKNLAACQSSKISDGGGANKLSKVRHDRYIALIIDHISHFSKVSKSHHLVTFLKCSALVWDGLAITLKQVLTARCYS